jgi:hypothetical protein
LVGGGGQSSHGYYTYLPFPYRERLKITLSSLPYFYNLTFQSKTGRLYALEECTNLISRGWYTVRAGIPGTGELLQLPAETGKPAAFHRLRVEKP